MIRKVGFALVVGFVTLGAPTVEAASWKQTVASFWKWLTPDPMIIVDPA